LHRNELNGALMNGARVRDVIALNQIPPIPKNYN
jgi:hypothetical protein